MFDFSAERATQEPPEQIEVVGPGQVSQYFGMRFEELDSRQVRKAYRSIVAQLISFRARKFAPQMAATTVVRGQGQGETEDVEPDHPWVRLLRTPNRHMPQTLFWKAAFKIFDVQGHVDFAVQYERDMGRRIPSALHIIYPEFGSVRPIYNTMGEPTAWEFQRTGGGNDILPTASIIRLKEPHPTAPWRTAGKLEAAAYEIDEMHAQNIFGRDKARDKGRPNVVLRDEGSKIETTADAKKLAREFSQMYHQKTGLTPVERGGMKIEQMNLTPQEMEFLESRRLNMDKLMMLFDIPKGMLSSEDSATGRGRSGAKKQWQEDTVQPFIDNRVEEMAHELRRIFDAEDSELTLKSPDVVTVPPEKRLEIDKKRMATGTPPNRILRERGEDEVDGGDTPFVSGSLQPLQNASASL